MKQITSQCCAMITKDSIWHKIRCSRKGTIEHDDKYYCIQHYPLQRKLAMESACEGVDTETLQKVKVKDLLESIAKYNNFLISREGCLR